MSARAGTTAAHRYTASQVAQTSQGRPMVCRGCDQSLQDSVDGMVVTFGDTLWHVGCRCTKCKRHVEHEQTLLLLSDGTPICASCTYICAVCSQVIMDDAIVTGEDSYHAECFNCKSCGSRIEELIFAKRSKGIWCMTCHNERVARSRKHAEAKRNRALRKEREKENSAKAVASPLADSESFDHDLTSASNLTDAHSIRSASTEQAGAPKSQVDSIRGPATSSSLEMNRSASSQRLGSVNSSPGQSASHSRTASNSARDIDVAPSTFHRPEDASLSVSPDGMRNEMGAPPIWNASRTHSLSTPTSPNFQLADRSPVGDARAATSDRSSSLTAPRAVDKASNRRSGFYGATSLSSLDSVAFKKPSQDGPLRSPIPLAIPESASGEGLVSESESHSSSQAQDTAPTSQSVSSAGSSPNPPININDLHQSRSFYDPDTLLFLDQITAASTPGSQPLARFGTSTSYPTNISDVSNAEVEHLSPDVNTFAFETTHVDGDDESFARSRTPKSEAAIKLRESIRLSREASGGSGMNLDVNLLEMLLVELDSTKKEVQELQSKYTAFRRASRSAFEGFSMAREEYDKELAARRELESQMEILRLKFTEQALRLASVDKGRKQTDELDRQSRELRMSVVATEKQLSQLRAEVELSTAQIEELANVDKDGDESTEEGVHSRSDAVEQKLADRLEKVKDEHRDEIERLILQRDELARELDELRLERDQVASELSVLSIRNAGLVDENAQLSRDNETARNMAARSTLSSPVMNGQQMHLAPSPTTLRSIFSGGSTSSQQSASRANATSPLPSDSDAETTSRYSESSSTTTAPVSSRKFKWGKANKGETHRPGIGSISQPLKALNRGTSLMSQTSETTMSSFSGNSSASVKTHTWQQTSILRPVRCEYCGDKMWGLNDFRCSLCGCYSHAKCAPNFTSPCNHLSSHAGHNGGPLLTPPLTEEVSPNPLNGGVYIFGNDLTTQAKTEKRHVPLVVSKCIAAVEAHGMNYEGIYRKTGGMGQTKLITQNFERGQDFDLEDLDKYNDIAAVTSCLKNYFRSLPDPLFTHELHERFVSCAEMPDGEARLEAIEDALSALPEAHFETARFLISHLHRIHLHSNENKMTPANLGVVFGPTLLRSSVASREFSDMGLKAKVIEILVDKYPRFFAKPPTPAKTIS